MASNYNFGENEPIITETGDTVNTFGIKVKNLFSDLYSKLNTDWNTMASTSNAGLMSSSDKTKINTLDSSGNAVSATKLATARTINDVSFNGTANITVYDSSKLPLTGGSLTGNLIMTNSTKIITTNIESSSSSNLNINSMNNRNINITTGGDGDINILTSSNNGHGNIDISTGGDGVINISTNSNIKIQVGSSSVLKITRNGLTYNGKKVLTE